MKKKATLCPLAPAHLAWLGAVQIAAVLAFVSPVLAAVPLIVFLVTALGAPFFPRFGFFLPIISRGSGSRREVALTFDDGPDPEVTPRLLELLSARSVPAAFFLAGEKAERYPELVDDILGRGHETGSHSYSHDVLLMVRSRERLRRDIAKGQEVFRKHGTVPLAFRPPVGITNPRLWRALLEVGMYCVNFTARARDFGNRRVGGIARRLIRKAKPGSILLLHDVNPGDKNSLEAWFGEVERLLDGLKEKDLTPVLLSRVIGRPVMKGTGGTGTGAVSGFYDGLASRYEEEQFGSGITIARMTEHEIVTNRLPEILERDHRVLEIGAGSGVFTLPMARLCKKVTAVDTSEWMLEVLKRNAAHNRIENITAVAADFRDLEPGETFDAVCSFSSFEYIPDLDGLFRKISGILAPGGVLYFTTAHRSFFRFFTQVGNAMRQGIWLHARGRRQVRRALEKSGFGHIEIETHVLKSVITRGMLMEVKAEKVR